MEKTPWSNMARPDPYESRDKSRQVDISPRLGSWTSCHSHTPTQKRSDSGYPPNLVPGPYEVQLEKGAPNRTISVDVQVAKVSRIEITGPRAWA